MIDAQGHGGGVALLWRNNSGVQILNSCNNFIDFEVSTESVGRWRYTRYYGYPENERRVDSWNLLHELTGKSSLPWCIIGDFNDLMVMDEKRGGTRRPRYLLDGFSEAVRDSGLIDFGYMGEKYTWERSRGTGRQVYVPKSRRFKFENMWISKQECRTIIQECWHKNEDADIMDKMAEYCMSEMDKVRKITEKQNHYLVLLVTDEEVKTTVFAMHQEKAPGIDGLNPAFFQTYWNIVGGDVSTFCKKFFETGELPKGVNSTLVLENKLKPCLYDIVSDNQSAFIEGRLLTDNALLAFEINHFIKRKTQGKNGVAGLKIDVSKDKVYVCELLQVQEIDKPGKYLGMPMYAGKNKTEIFGFLNDRVEQKLQGWTNQELSKGGKLTLLKSVAQAVPNSRMSLFLVLVNICEEME
ncbi:uncharacterized protein LOC141700766 [Apium graveolens]|uniref:uncharacterized protein LOC141700766 n=1 Tax=Apium graveolens TaxID=4045 RepID=UPI003D78FBAF